MRSLQKVFGAQATDDGDVYVPIVEPSGTVAYVFVGQEPSLGRWTKTKDDGRDRIAAGFRELRGR